MDRLLKAAGLALIAWAVAGVAALTWLLMAAPLTIGAGRFEAFVTSLERFDFRRPAIALVALVWVVPMALVQLWRQARRLGSESSRLRAALEPLFKPVPVMVDVDARIPVRVPEPLHVPVELTSQLALDEELEVEAELPVRLEIPIDTEVETTVMRFGVLRVPVRAKIPVDLVLPVKGKVRVRATVPISLREVVRVQLPEFEVPIASRLETRIDLVANLRRPASER